MFKDLDLERIVQGLGETDCYFTGTELAHNEKYQAPFLVQMVLEPIQKIVDLTQEAHVSAQTLKKLSRMFRKMTGAELPIVNAGVQTGQQVREQVLKQMYGLGRSLLDLVV